MTVNRWAITVSAVAIAAAFTIDPGLAQQTAGTLGSPEATTTVPGDVLPPFPQKFGGTIELNAAQSKPWWPPRVVPPRALRTSY